MGAAGPVYAIMAAMPASDSPLLVVGLGNPGPKYAGTRHNIGHLVLDELAGRAEPMPASFTAHRRSNAEIARTRRRLPGGGERALILAKPRSYMNLSGGPVAALARFFKIDPAGIIVVHDELDLDPGVVRLKRGGGEGGHNGLRSISKALGTRDYLRVRVGIGRPPGRMDPADYVLREPPAREREEFALAVAGAADAVEDLIDLGLTGAQNRVHGR